MRLSAIFNEAIKDSDRLVLLYEQLSTSNQRAIRSDWSESFYKAKLTNWPKGAGLWRSKSAATLLIGTSAAGLTHKDFNHDSLSLLLRMALVMAMAAADRIVHEAVSKQFVSAIESGELDKLVKIPLSLSYEIAMAARTRKGKGGRKKSRPATHLKKELLEKLYWQSFLSSDSLSSVCKALSVANIFQEFGAGRVPALAGNGARDRWSLIYKRRNQIAHECDIIRQNKMRRVKRHIFTATELKEDTAFAREFGQFLAMTLDT